MSFKVFSGIFEFFRQVELIKPEEPKPEETTQVNNETSATITAKDCLHITVRAEELPKMDTVGRIDPYFRIDYEGRKVYRSPVIKDDPTPVWPRITILKSHFTKKMKFTVKDYDRFKKNEYVSNLQISVVFSLKNIICFSGWRSYCHSRRNTKKRTAL